MPADATAVPTAELLVYDVIGSSWWDDGVTAKQVVNFLADQPDDAEVHVRINSPGGDAFEGVAIYNVLAQNPRRIVVHVDGLAASAASVIAMAGDEIRMAENALMMIHNSSGLTIGTAAEHEKTIEVLRKLDVTLATTYAARSGRDLADVSGWMDAESWFGADEAIEHGLADATDEAKRVEATWGRDGHRLLATYQHAPQHLPDVSVPRARQPSTRIAACAAEEPKMALEQICAALGLPEDAQEDTIVAAVAAKDDELERLAAKLDEAKSNEPDPVAWVPRSEFDALRQRVETAETKNLDRELEDAIKAAEGKLVFNDADRDRFRKHIRDGAMSLDAFREEIAARAVSPLAVKDDPPAQDNTDHGLTDAEIKLCEQTGLNKERFAANKAKRAGKL
jgi:ATP-dependent protease ClpP protease subunit